MLRPHLPIAAAATGFALLIACVDEDDTTPTPADTITQEPSLSEEEDKAAVSVSVVSSNPYGALVPSEPDSSEGADAATSDAAKVDAAMSDAAKADAAKADAGSSTSSSASSSGTSGTTSSASSSGTTSSASSTGGTAGTCSVTKAGATGPEPGGMIPVCCAPTASQKAALDELFVRLNQYRAEKGKLGLTYDTKLEAAVQGHCEHMVKHGFFDHLAPEPVVYSPQDRAALCGTTALGENLAGGQSTPSAVMAAWKASAGHNSNMLANWKRVGLCRAGSYWGQIFGN